MQRIELLTDVGPIWWYIKIPIYDFLLVVNNNSVRPLNELDLSMALEVQFDGAALPIFDFIIVVNSNICPVSTPFWDIKFETGMTLNLWMTC